MGLLTDSEHEGVWPVEVGRIKVERPAGLLTAFTTNRASYGDERFDTSASRS